MMMSRGEGGNGKRARADAPGRNPRRGGDVGWGFVIYK